MANRCKLFLIAMCAAMMSTFSVYASGSTSTYDITADITAGMTAMSTQVFAIIAVIVPVVLSILGAKLAITKGISIFKSLTSK